MLKKTNQRRKLTIWTARILMILAFCHVTFAQGLNYPGNSPVMDTGAGNARTDANNLFTRNNIAGLTEIADEEDELNGKSLRKSKWRLLAEVQGTHFTYERTFTPLGFQNQVVSSTSITVPNFSGEITFTPKNRRYGFGIGISQEFGFESKLKDSAAVLGNQAQFFDTKVASHDLTFAGAVRLHKKFSIGASLIVGRGFLVQIGTIPQLATAGIIRQSRLDVSKIGGAGYSLGANWRPTKYLSLGINYKSQRKYDLTGSLDSFLALATPAGLQLSPIKLPVRVPFRFPAVIEAGISLQPVKRLTVAVDVRYFYYGRSLNSVTVFDQSSGNAIAVQSVNAKNVKLFLLGGYYELNESHKLHFGTGYTTNGIPDQTFNPGLTNTGARSLTGGFSKKIADAWFIASLTGYFGLDRTIAATANPAFPGVYQNHGYTIGLAVRK